jgi:hypothetical protein
MNAIPREFIGDLVECKARVAIDAALGVVVIKTDDDEMMFAPESATKLAMALIKCSFRLARMESDDCPA